MRDEKEIKEASPSIHRELKGSFNDNGNDNNNNKNN
jgi:hypothetical protein